jgi:tRNA(His) guanylyltransferase
VSSDRTALGDRIKAYEAVTKTTLPRRTYTLIRADGRSFHGYLRGAARPYDEQFMADMDATAEALCREVSGAVFAYVQSDEISVLVCDFESAGTQPWFGGEVQKIVSIAAATATAALNARRPGKLATFDARVFTIADPVEVANAFIWRQRDCVRNSITMAAQAKFSARQLHGVNSAQMQEMLWQEHGINWNSYPDGCKRGRVIVKASGEREVTWTHKRTRETSTTTALRTWWETRPAPHFTLNAGGFLAEAIPPMPTLADESCPPAA